jgi:hypothetical protein
MLARDRIILMLARDRIILMLARDRIILMLARDRIILMLARDSRTRTSGSALRVGPGGISLAQDPEPEYRAFRCFKLLLRLSWSR